jgi:hypothetical protein
MSIAVMNTRRILYAVLLIILNVIGLVFVCVIFLGASNTNGEGAPIESETIGFLRMLTYVVAVSISFSFAAWILTRLFRRSLPNKNFFFEKIFWIQLGSLLTIFLFAFLYLSL